MPLAGMWSMSHGVWLGEAHGRLGRDQGILRMLRIVPLVNTGSRIYTQPTLRTEVRWPPSSKPLPKPQAERTPETSSKKESTIFDENIKILGALCRYKYE